MLYSYTARSASGQTSTGVLAADSPAQLHQKLRSQGLFPIAVESGTQDTVSTARLFRRRRQRVSKRDLLTFTSQLAIMIRAGVDLAEALESISKHCTNPVLKTALDEVHGQVSGGCRIAEALQSQDHVFGTAYVAGISAGEASGRLIEVLERLVQLLKNEMQMRSTLRTVLAYPIILASVSMLVLAALTFFVLPQFAKVFKQFDVPLPVTTQMLLAISHELKGRFWLWGGMAIAAVFGAFVLRSSDVGRRHWDRLIVRIYVVRDVVRALVVGRSLRLLSTLIGSGVPLLEGIELTQASLRNVLYWELFEKVKRSVLDGEGISDPLSDGDLIPSAATQMIMAAERAGTLAPVMEVIGEYYEQEAETRLRDLATILEPIIIIVMGGVVAFVVMSVMLPLFDFATVARSGR